jgi:hypothetical protein
MRYFFFLAVTKALLAAGIGQPTTATRLIQAPCPLQ